MQLQIKQQIQDYLLNQKEAEKIIDALKDRLDGKKLKEMFASSDRQEYAQNMLVPLIEKEVSKRKHIVLPTDEQMLVVVREIIEDIEGAS